MTVKWWTLFLHCSILLWKDLEEKFILCNQYSTQEPCSCLHFTQVSLIVGAEKFYEIDLKTFEIEGITLFLVIVVVPQAAWTSSPKLLRLAMAWTGFPTGPS